MDICSVWTITSIILPYCVVNHLFFLKDFDPFWGPRVSILLICCLMVLTFALPYQFHDNADQYKVIPFTAGMHFILQATYYSLCCRRVTVRSKLDLVHLPLSVAFMLTAYHLQLHDKDLYCFGPDSAFQSHAAWHSVSKAFSVYWVDSIKN